MNLNTWIWLRKKKKKELLYFYNRLDLIPNFLQEKKRKIEIKFGPLKNYRKFSVIVFTTTKQKTWSKKDMDQRLGLGLVYAMSLSSPWKSE